MGTLKPQNNRSLYSNTVSGTLAVDGWAVTYLAQRGGAWAGYGPTLAHGPLLAVPNVTAHPSTASVPLTVLLYNGPLLCGFNVAIKG